MRVQFEKERGDKHKIKVEWIVFVGTENKWKGKEGKGKERKARNNARVWKKPLYLLLIPVKNQLTIETHLCRRKSRQWTQSPNTASPYCATRS